MTELSIDNETFQRCQMPIPFQVFDDQNLNARATPPLTDLYSPEVRAAFNLTWDLPSNHKNINLYKQRINTPPIIPYYNRPASNSEFPHGVANPNIPQPPYTSLLPLLIAAHRNGIDIHQYDIISERNSFRKIAMNNEDYVVGVQKLGRTLFLIRHDRRTVNMNDPGHRFEQLCTPDCNLRASYHQLIQGHIGSLRTLIKAETDAVSKANGEAIELKCRQTNSDIPNQYWPGYWLQAFLGGVTTVVVAHGLDRRPLRLMGDVRDYQVATLINDQVKNSILNFLYEVLDFLSKQVIENEVYLFSRRMDQKTCKRGLYLYRVARTDKLRLSFISREILNQVVQTGLEDQWPKNITTGHGNRRNISRNYRAIEDSDNDDDNPTKYSSDEDIDLGEIEENYYSEMNRMKKKKEENASLRRTNEKSRKK